MDYIEFRIGDISEEDQNLVIAQLAETGFESFCQEPDRLLAYIPSILFDEVKVKAVLGTFHHPFTFETIPDQNWNREWEKNFSPVDICGICYVRAPFHPKVSNYKYEIIIEPKMSFGTAHHETTSQMIELMLQLDLKGKKVLDMGCGTGILAILADLMGASEILAVDNDEWAFSNSVENVERNRAGRITVVKGGIDKIRGKFDLILANINRNILLEQIPAYHESLEPGGFLLMSGFYKEDLPVLMEKASESGFRPVMNISRNRWMAMKLTR